MWRVKTLVALSLCVALAGCDDEDSEAESTGGEGGAVAGAGGAAGGAGGEAGMGGAHEMPDDTACDAEPVIRTTAAGVEFVRTPDACFEGLPGWPFEAEYVEIDGLRQGYVDEGPADGPVVLLLHGQPSWSYLYRKMIPVLAEAGYRVIAMDHLGMGRSDKPVDIEQYTYLGHNDRLLRFIEALELRDIHLFVQDWGSLIGLRVAGLNPDLFARIAVGNGDLPVIPEGFQPFEPVENPNEPADLPLPFGGIPDQQVPFYDGCDPLFSGGDAPQGGFGAWMEYALRATNFRPSEVIEALTWFDLPPDEEAAYDAPYPSRIYMAGPRTFPSLVNELPGTTEAAWAGLMAFEKPFITLWAANDPGNLGQCATQQKLVDSIPGAQGLPHMRLPEASHFLQDDQGAQIAQRLAALFKIVPHRRASRYCELLIVYMHDGALEAEVWGTPGLNACPEEAWAAIDIDAIQAETGALAVIRNGPRHWIPNTTTSEAQGERMRRTFGTLEMNLLASVPLESGAQESTPYTPQIVRRATTYTFNAGEEIYELTSAEGEIYVMQSMSLMSDPELTFADLPNLSARLSLPEGWAYQARTLSEDLVMSVDGEATVLIDDLGNTYQQR
ncbi:MAG: haloalkane dehalogenase [Bradymonadia bacterium]